MRTVGLNLPAQSADDPRRLAALTRHLNARLLDFGPGGPEVVSSDEGRGLVAARFPGRDTERLLGELSQACGVRACLEGGCVLFYLNESIQFEDLDYVWGCLFDLLV